MRVLTMIISALALFASVASAAPMPHSARQSVARRSALPGIILARDGDSPDVGTYVITNKVNSGNGDKLAITYNGQDNAATVTAASSGNLSQQWTIAVDDMGGQNLKPVNDPTFEASWGATGVSVSPPGHFVWTIKKTDSGYTIQDSGATAFWGLDSATDNAQVTIGAGSGDDKQTWLFEKISP